MKLNSEIIIGNAGADCEMIQVRCDGWRGGFGKDLRAELHRLGLELRRLCESLKGEARFDLLEHQLMLVSREIVESAFEPVVKQ